MNKIQIDGRLVADSEIRTSKKGNLTTFTICNNDFPEKAQFFPCVYFDEIDLKKGEQVYIVGSLVNNTYTDKNGVKHYTTNIRVNSIERS